MFNFKTITKVIFLGLLFSAFLPKSTFATSTKIEYDENGKLRAVPQDKSKLNNISTLCEGMTARIWARKSNLDTPPNVLVQTAVQVGNQKKMETYDFFDFAKEKLTSHHDLSKMEIGCLTNNGGLGISIPHSQQKELDLKAQVDRKGRVFFGYDQIGLELLEPRCPTSKNMERFKRRCKRLGLPIVE